MVAPKRELPAMLAADVIVAGGGVSGFVAAVAAARAGAQTVLVEQNSFLGGTATASLMTAVVHSRQAGGIGRELLIRLAQAGGAPSWDPQPGRSSTVPFEHEVYKQVALEMVQEAGVDLVLSTSVLGPVMSGKTIRGIEVHGKSGLASILGTQVVDCTGDADVAARAGAPMSKGREKDGKMRPFSLLFRVGGLDLDRLQAWSKDNVDEMQPAYRRGTLLHVNGQRVVTRISGFYSLVLEAKEQGLFPEELHYFRLESCWMDRGIALCNTTRIYDVDGTDTLDLTRGELIGRDQVARLMEFIRTRLPGGQNAYLLDVAPRLGIRETRRIVARKTIREEDIYSDARVPDPVMTFEGWFPARTDDEAIDIHMPEPIEGSPKDLLDVAPESVEKEHHIFQLPYRSLLPKQIVNLLVAGRAIGVSHFVDGYTRNQVVAMRTGEAAGVAAAVALRDGVAAHEVSYPRLRAQLEAGGMDDIDVPASQEFRGGRVRAG